MMKLILLTTAAAALASCATGEGSSTAASTDAGADVAAAAAPSAAAYLQAAAASDQFEIQSSRLALTKARSADVRAFAQMMVDHHTRTTADLAAAARQAGLSPPPPALTPDKAAKVAALEGADPAAFDAMYMREQVAGHVEALALHQGYAQSGDQAALRAAAAKTAPIVSGHLDRARTLKPPG